MRIPHKTNESESAEKKIRDAQYGNQYNEAALCAAHVIHNAATFDLLTSPTSKETIADQVPKDQRKCIKYHKDQAWKIISREIIAAFKSRNGSFLRAMADACERNGDPVEPIRAYMGIQIEAAKAFGLPIPSLRRLKQSLTKSGIAASDKTFQRAYSAMGGKGKSGRPRK